METDATPELTGPMPPMAYMRRCAREPYRILFPLGTAIGLLGVAVWPLAAVGWAPSPPALNHPRLLIEGFLGCFLIGFLTTALPGLLAVEPLSGNLVIILTSTLLSVSMFHLLGAFWLGDLLFTAALLVPLIAFGLRFRHRKDNPPPSFVLLALGLVGGAVGAFLQAEKAIGVRISPFLLHVSFLLLFEGFPLLPLLGASAFFFPRIYGAGDAESPPHSLRPSREWCRQALAALGAGLLIFASFLIEAEGMRRLGGLVRVASAAAYVTFSLPFSRELLSRGTVAAAMRIAFACALFGLVRAPFLPPSRTGALHFFFLGGVGLMAMAIGAQVVYGLSGRGFLLRYRFLPFEYAVGAVVAALAARIGADYFPSRRTLLLSVSALLWVGALALWAFSVLPFVLCPATEEEDEPKGSEPEQSEPPLEDEQG